MLLMAFLRKQMRNGGCGFKFQFFSFFIFSFPEPELIGPLNLLFVENIYFQIKEFKEDDYFSCDDFFFLNELRVILLSSLIRNSNS